MDNETKQSYKQSYTDNVELSIFNCGHEYCQPGHTWGPGVRDHYLIHLVVAGRGVYQVNPFRTLNLYIAAKIPRPCGNRCTISTCPAGRSPSARP